MFIRLTLSEDNPVLVNLSTVTNIFPRQDGRTMICHEGENCYTVSENFEEISNLINLQP